MKRMITGAFILALLISTAQAQETTKAHHKHQHKGQRADVYGQINLTAEQKASFKIMREDFRKQMTELKANTALTAEQKGEKRKELARQHKMRSEALLTPAQKNQLATIKENRKNERKTANYTKGQKMQRAHKRMHKMEQVQQELDLSASQQQQMKKIRGDYKEKFAALKADASGSVETKKEKAKALRMQQQQEMKAVLTPAQAEKMKQLRKERQTKNTR